MLQQGTKAPDFTLPDKDNHPVSLSDFKGKKSFFIFIPRTIQRAAPPRPALSGTRILNLRLWRGCHRRQQGQHPLAHQFCLEV